MLYICRIKIMYNHISPKNGDRAPLIADDVFEIIIKVGTTRTVCFEGVLNLADLHLVVPYVVRASCQPMYMRNPPIPLLSFIHTERGPPGLRDRLRPRL